MERHTRTILVGAPTGSGPNHYGDPNVVVLPRTGVAVLLSSRRHQFGDEADLRTTHEPEWPVRITSADYFSGKDPVLDAALVW